MSQKIKNILFDLGGVIISLNKQEALNRFTAIGFPNIEDYLGEFRQEGIFLEYEEGKISPEGFYKEFRKLCGNDNIAAEDIDNGWLGFLAGIPPYKFELLKQLRKKYKVYLLSNTNPSVIKWASSEAFSPVGLPIQAYFDKCYLSYQRKPIRVCRTGCSPLQSGGRWYSPPCRRSACCRPPPCRRGRRHRSRDSPRRRSGRWRPRCRG